MPQLRDCRWGMVSIIARVNHIVKVARCVVVSATPTLVLLAGPNGAGKTTFIHRVLRQRAEAFRVVTVNAVSPFLPCRGRWRGAPAAP